MLKLLHSIFSGGERRGRYPASLIEMASERAVEGTDPRIRALPGYAHKLREPVIHAIDHVIELVDAIHVEPVTVARANYVEDPRLGALFASAESMLDILGRDQALRDYLGTAEGQRQSHVNTLLLAERAQRPILGMDLVGDQVRRDVAQVEVNFFAHRLLEPHADAEETRRHLKRRAFDFLLTQALDRISTTNLERVDLAHQRDLVTRKLSALERSGWGFKLAQGGQPDLAGLMTELDEITGHLQALGPDQDILETHLDILVEVLSNAEHQLWSEPITLFLDAMNIVRDERDAATRRIDFLELHGGKGQGQVMLPLVIAPDQLPAPVDFLTAVERYL
jgi:hypothetical protein